jgi:hypothetical protein
MAIPPTTPPTIAPTGVARVAATGGLDDVEVEDGTLLEVETIELGPPGARLTKK